MTSPAYEIATYLAAQGVGTFAASSGWSINVGQESPSPDDIITINDTGGGEPDTDQLDLLQPTFQVRVRSFSYLNAYAKQEAIRDLLILNDPIVMGSSTYIAIMMSIDISNFGRDDTGRNILIASYRAIKERN